MPRVPPVTRAVLPWSAHLPEDPIAVPEVSAAAISQLLLPVWSLLPLRAQPVTRIVVLIDGGHARIRNSNILDLKNTVESKHRIFFIFWQICFTLFF